VSVVAAKAELQGQRVALGTALDESLELLRAELSQGRGMNATLDNNTKNLGAKFIKP
jgi:hypothetical protein